MRALGLMRIDRYSLPNVLAGEALVPELIQHAATPDAIAEATAVALDPATEARLLPRYTTIHEALRRGADRSAAEAIATLVERAP